MLRPQPLPPLPDETARIARAAFPKEHPYLALADTLGELFADEQFAALFPQRGQSALAPWRLALATILQFAEGNGRGAMVSRTTVPPSRAATVRLSSMMRRPRKARTAWRRKRRAVRAS